MMLVDVDIEFGFGVVSLHGQRVPRLGCVLASWFVRSREELVGSKLACLPSNGRSAVTLRTCPIGSKTAMPAHTDWHASTQAPLGGCAACGAAGLMGLCSSAGGNEE